MEITNKITKYLKNLRSTQVSPNLRIPQGVQAFTTVFLGLLTSFGRHRSSKSPRLSSVPASVFTPTLAIAVLGISFFSQTAYAASYINVSSGSGGTVSLGSIKPSSTGVSASGSDTLTITTNCSAGYSVYVSAQNGGDTNLTNTNSSVTTNNTISASSTAVGSTATTLNSNTWGITGDSASASASKYVGLPSYADATNTALISNSSASTSGDNKSTVYYGVKVDTTLSPGTYSGDVLYTTLVSDKCNNYTVHFDANGGSGSMSDQTIPVGTATPLTANGFTRSGYAFLGWATDKNATGQTYLDGQSVKDISDFNTVITLYAVWAASSGTMQSWTGCPSLAKKQSVFLTDTRDNKVYAVKKLPDGKCWMMQNLTIGSTVTANTSMALTKADTNIDNDNTYYLPPAGRQGTGTITELPNVNGTPGTADFTNDKATDAHAKTQFRTKGTGYDSSSVSYANDSDTGYYNFYTATLGFSSYQDGKTSGSSTRDICPRGWRLPWTGNSGAIRSGSADFYALALSYNSSPDVWHSYIAPDSTGSSGPYSTDITVKNGIHRLAASPLATNAQNDYAGFSYTGSWSGTGANANYVGESGGYWSSSVYGSEASYRLYLRSSDIIPTDTVIKYSGFAVRCIAEDNYTISYSSTGADSGEASKTSESVYESGSVTTPTVGTMTKSGYEFKGWSLTSGATEAAYTAEQTVTISDLISAASSAGQTPTPGSTITLYPVWTQSVVYMQDWSGCSALAESESVTLVDSRDNKEYAVKKLPDGKCWMMQNLTIGSTGAQTLTPENTNIDDGKTYYLPPAGKQGSSTIDDSSTLTATDAANFASSADQHAKTQFRMKDSNIANDSDTGYYNFYTATLGYSWYGTGSSGSSTRDICPKNWRLPKTTDSGSNVTTVGSVNDFTYLALQYNSTTGWNGSATGTSGYGYYNNNDVVRNPMYKSAASPLATTTRNNYAGFSYSGYWDGSSASVVGSYGSYWSSSVYVTDDGYSLSFSSSSIGPQGGGYKNVGRAVRCVAKDARTLSDIAYMQDINSDIISNTATNTYKQLTDSRDNNKYYVKKLADGKLWMVQNLRLTNYKLTSADSDVSADFDLTTGITYSGSSGWCQNNNATCDNVKALYYNSSEASNSSKSSYYGALYNWYTATAGTGTYFTGANVQASSSICPKGWRLPTGGSSGEFVALDKAWGGTGANRSSANTHGTFTGDYRTGDNGGFGLAGYINGSVDYVGSSGFYWSSTANDASSAYDLSLYKSNADVYPRDYFSKFFGNSVRCIAN